MSPHRPAIGQRPSTEELLSHHHRQSTEMSDLTREGATKTHIRVEDRYTDELENGEASGTDNRQEIPAPQAAQVEYRVYKRRWFGLVQLMLLNIIWLTFAAVGNTSAEFFSTTPSIIAWLSTAFLFAFVAVSPFTLYTLSRFGPKSSIIAASVLILVGNWTRYAGTRSHPPSFAVTMFGQILIGFAQPFVLSAPTRYSDLWYSPQGRISATAAMSLANPFGGALGQLIDPFLASSPSDIPNMTLYIAIISSVAAIPSFFIPTSPPTPVSPLSTLPRPPILQQIALLIRSLTFWLLFIPFATYVGFFNSLSSLLTQVLTPYGYSEIQSGIAGALLILVGLVAAAITSPIVDRSKRYLLLIKTLVPIIAICYLAFIWAPPSKGVAAPYIICGVLGAASFSLVPIALEWLVEVTWPVGPEVGSVICWAGGQAFGGIFIVVSDALQDGKDAKPAFNMQKALIFQAIVAVVVVPTALVLGRVGSGVSNKRLDREREGTRGSVRSADNDQG